MTTGVCVYPSARTLSRAFSSRLMSWTTYGMPYWFSFRSTALQGMQPGWVNSSVTGWWGFTGAAFWVRERPATFWCVAGLTVVGSVADFVGVAEHQAVDALNVAGGVGDEPIPNLNVEGVGVVGG